MNNKIIKNSLALVSLLFVTACASAAIEEATDTKTEANTEMVKLEKAQAKIAAKQKGVYVKMSSLVAGASCKTDAQCASMPVGSAACGGPANYLVYSTMIGDQAVSELTALSKQTKELDIAMAKLDQVNGNAYSGICRYNTPSDVACIDNICKAVANEIIR